MKQKISKTIGGLLKEEREKLDMSQIEFAKYLDMNSSTYERQENNRNHDMKLECMIKILKKVDIPLDLFIPIEIINKYCIYVVPKKENDVKKIVAREFSKLLKKLERQFSKDIKPVS
jgi:transcriptional regulator with XRE-family HTH domain